MLNFIKGSAIKNIVFLFPHPDDEIFTSASLIHQLVSSGIIPTVICLTNGENGIPPRGIQKQDLGNVRKLEFIKIMKRLRCKYDIHNFIDGDIENSLSIQALNGLIPFDTELIITYDDLHGFTRHKDHIALSKKLNAISNQLNFQIAHFVPSTLSNILFKNYKSFNHTHKTPYTLKSYISKILLWCDYKSQNHSFKTGYLFLILIIFDTGERFRIV